MKYYTFPGVIRFEKKCGTKPEVIRDFKRIYARTLRRQLRAECRNPEIISLPQNPQAESKKLASAHWTGNRLVLVAA